jgi:hypothetical protein
MSESKIERATRIKVKMAANRLTAQWLMLRLSQDHGIEIDKYKLSKILSGAVVSGEDVLDATEQVLDRYENYYKREVS